MLLSLNVEGPLIYNKNFNIVPQVLVPQRNENKRQSKVISNILQQTGTYKLSLAMNHFEIIRYRAKWLLKEKRLLHALHSTNLN